MRLTLQGPLPGSTRALEWTCGSHALVRLEGGEGGEQPYTPYQRAGGAFEAESRRGRMQRVVQQWQRTPVRTQIAEASRCISMVGALPTSHTSTAAAEQEGGGKRRHAAELLESPQATLQSGTDLTDGEGIMAFAVGEVGATL